MPRSLSLALVVTASLGASFLGCSSDDAAPAAPPPPEGPTGPCGEGLSLEPPPTPKIHTPRWAFEPWISKDISDRDDTYAFVDGFAERGIPVGVVVLDSPWEVNYNDFTPNPSRYPDFGPMVADFAARDIRVVLWVTQMINSSSYDFEPGGDKYEGPASNYQEAVDCGFFVNDGAEYQWWKGKGGGLDFFNPKAAAWWHWQQNRVLDLGVSGWKLDFGENYVRSKEVKTHAGTVSHQAYSEEYYRDYLAYGVARRGPEEFVTMVRPWDASYDFEGRFFARKEHAPVAWVGDNRRDYLGLADALDHLFVSAKAGYVVIGSDIGGYLNVDDKTLEDVPADTETFLRWTAVGALTPFMQLHGRANLTPWTVPDHADESVAAWRYWATLHHELVPFFYSLAEEAYAGAEPILRPVGEPASWPGDYRFFVGDALLVAPILAPGGARDVPLPPGARYYDWWDPTADALEGGATLSAYAVPDWSRVPLFVKEGAIVPMEIASAVTGLGTEGSAGSSTVLVYPGSAPSRFLTHDADGAKTEIEARRDGASVTVSLSRRATAVLLRVRDDAGLAGASVDGAALSDRGDRAGLDGADDGFFREPATRSVWVKLPAGGAASVTLTP